jgi:hypothetical protein
VKYVAGSHLKEKSAPIRRRHNGSADRFGKRLAAGKRNPKKQRADHF